MGGRDAHRGTDRQATTGCSHGASPRSARVSSPHPSARLPGLPGPRELLGPKKTRKHVRVSRYAYTLRRAARLNATVQYQREIRRRKTAAEGVFAHCDGLAWDRARFRGREIVDCQGSIAALAHNVLKALTKRRF